MNQSAPNVGQASTLRSTATEDGSRRPSERASASRSVPSALPTYLFRVAVAQARGARRLRLFRVGQSKGPCQIPLRSASADGEAACPSSPSSVAVLLRRTGVAVLLRRVERPRSCRIGSWGLNTYRLESRG